MQCINNDIDKHGKVRDVYMPLDYNSGKPRGFCFVEFLDEEDAR